MKHINFEGVNLRLGAPAGSRPGEVDTLMAFRNPHTGTIASAWKPNAEELAALNAGYHIVLTVWSNVHPPVSVHIQKMREIEDVVHAMVGDNSQTRCGLAVIPEGERWSASRELWTCEKCKR